MQYILTEKEYNALVSRDEHEALKLAHKILWSHYCSYAKPPCRGEELGDTRCDHCPIAPLVLSRSVLDLQVAGIAPLPYDVARLVCPRKQEYSK